MAALPGNHQRIQSDSNREQNETKCDTELGQVPYTHTHIIVHYTVFPIYVEQSEIGFVPGDCCGRRWLCGWLGGFDNQNKMVEMKMEKENSVRLNKI